MSKKLILGTLLASGAAVFSAGAVNKIHNMAAPGSGADKFYDAVTAYTPDAIEDLSNDASHALLVLGAGAALGAGLLATRRPSSKIVEGEAEASLGTRETQRQV